MTKRRGFSLMELLVALGLSALLLLVVVQVVVPLTRSLLRAYAEMDLARTALRLKNCWRADLAGSTPEGVNLTGPEVWLLHPLASQPQARGRVYGAHALVYRLEGGRLTRSVCQLASPAVAAPPGWDKLALTRREERLLALDVASQSCEVTPSAVVVSVRLETPISGRTLQYQWRQAFPWRNP